MSRTSKPQKPRPEKFEDIPNYERRTEVDLAEIAMFAGHGVMAAAERLVDCLRKAHPGIELDVSFTNDKMQVTRPLSDDERAQKLAEAQKSWDDQHTQFVKMNERAGLKVGDAYDGDGGRAGHTCKAIYGWPCTLDYEHEGDHFEILDGKVAQITPAGGPYPPKHLKVTP